MVKILYLINEIKEAGAQKHLLGVINSLDKNLFEHKVITLEELGIKKIYGLPGIIGLFKLIDLIKKDKFDIIHSYLFSENIIGSIAARIAKIPVIITSRRDTGMLCQGKIQHILAYRLTNRWVDKIICVSEAVKRVVIAKEKVNPAKITVIYNGVDVNKFSFQPSVLSFQLKASLGVKEDEFVVGIIANFSWIKGHKDFVETAQMVLKELPNTKFMLVGEGPERQRTADSVERLGLKDKVLFLGVRKDIPELLSKMDVSVNASYSEGMSNTILQSMAAGVPVVATAVDGNMETVVDGVTGILVPPKNPKSMSEAIIRILKDKELAKKMGENARNLANEKFTSEIMLRNMENLYKRLLKSKIAFILSQFPETHETFILREFKSLREKEVEFEILSLKSCNDEIIHPDAVEFKKKTIYGRFLNPAFIIQSLLHPLKTINSFIYVIATYWKNPIELLKTFYVWLECLYFVGIMKYKKISHIHSHWATMPTTAAMILHKLTGLPFSFTAHAWDIFVSQIGLEEKIKNAKFIATCTNNNLKFLQNFCNNREYKKIYLNYHGLDIKKLKFNKKQDSGNSPINILSIGRLVETKGFPYLIEACKELKERDITFQCKIVGVGSLKNRLKRLINKNNLQNDVYLLGLKSQEEIKKLFYDATVFIQPSIIAKNGDRDGIPNVILEAMAYGTPVIATDVSGIPEVLINWKTGILVPQKDSKAITEAIISLNKDNLIQENLANNARRLIEERFNSDKNIQDLVRIFQENNILNHE